MRNVQINACLVGLLLAACSSNGQQKSCTLIGCTDEFAVEISQSSGAALGLAADLVIDGRAVSCPALSGTDRATCDSTVVASSYELQSCTDSTSGSVVTETCVGTGNYALRITITGTPKLVDISLRGTTAPVAEQTFQPQYTSAQPNGAGCDPACSQAFATWTLP
jgi:hypothetical protein